MNNFDETQTLELLTSFRNKIFRLVDKTLKSDLELSNNFKREICEEFLEFVGDNFTNINQRNIINNLK